MNAKQLSASELWEQGKHITLTVDAVMPIVELEDGSKQSFSVFRAFVTEILDGKNLVGTISGGTGYVTLDCDGDEYLISHEDLWTAFMEALEKDSNGNSRNHRK